MRKLGCYADARNKARSVLAFRRSKAFEEEKCPDEEPNAACANRQNEVQKVIHRLDRLEILLPALRAVILDCFLSHDALPVCYLVTWSETSFPLRRTSGNPCLLARCYPKISSAD